MSGKSTYLQRATLDHLFGRATFTPPPSLFFTYWKGDPTDDGTDGVEISGPGFARIEVTNDDTEFDRSGDVVSNINAIDFGTPAGDWATNLSPATHVAAWDDATAGNMMYSWPLPASLAFPSGVPVVVNPGQYTWNED